MKEETKDKENNAKRAKKFEAKITTTKNDDFVNNNDTHISC